jgi:hypothetical protein
MGAESITRAKSIARGLFTANYYTLKLVFWQTKVMVLKDSVLTILGKKKNSKISIFRCQKSLLLSGFYYSPFFCTHNGGGGGEVF